MRGETEHQRASKAAGGSRCRRSYAAKMRLGHGRAAVLCCLVSAADTEGAGQLQDCISIDGADKGRAASCASAIGNYSTTKKLTNSECMR